MSAKASRGGLDSYFRKQSLAIKQQAAKDEAQKKRHMSAAAANADLNKYFDSLQSHTKKGKLTTLAKEVTDLSKDVKAILQPMKQLQDSATASKNAVSSLKEDTKMLLKDDTSRRGVAERAEKAAERAAESAKTAANRRAQDETIVIRQALKRVPKTKYLKVGATLAGCACVFREYTILFSSCLALCVPVRAYFVSGVLAFCLLLRRALAQLSVLPFPPTC